ncbi:cell wall-active antibiotics response protein LiaF [Cohnella thermotolerans]|uniref:cell wall-active antibiotics response protein LiaF n=1 Tax=Cohnella thermotolerans TaxID=329858 RepID=UPI000416C711|nr:cell wall-active antibiotics response protein LiaF [Cohnella thermotolerans]
MKRISNHALLFIGAGLYLALGGLAGYATVNAIILLWLGIDRFRYDRNRFAVILIVICALVLVVKQIGLMIVLILISLGIYYLKAKPHHTGPIARRHRFMLNIRLDRQPWVLRSFSYWHAFGEVRMDLSMAVPEERETTIVLQGLVGDVDLIVPEDYGLEVEASVMLGQAGLNSRMEGGFFHRAQWRTPDYDAKEQKVKLQLFYLVGNIRIRPI